jgi:quercetin dioxygenase-like cupin family protein
MSYKPSPRPQYDHPAKIPYSQVTRHLWGDAESGKVADWIYVSNQNIHALVFGLPPYGSFTHSQAYRTVFGADEVLTVLEGSFALANPQTGEVQRASRGESIFFRKDTWHHGFNLAESPVRVLEFFSPPPARGTSGVYAQTKPYLPEEDWTYVSPASLRGWPFPEGPAEKTLYKISEQDLLLELRGANPKAILENFVSSENLRAGRIHLPPGSHIPAETHSGDEALYVEAGHLFIHIPETPGETWFELHSKDGFYLPSGVGHEYHNMGDQPARILFGVAPNVDSFGK